MLLTELQVLHVDFLKQDNAVSHHTWEFQTSTPVFRRGQVFHLRLVLNQPLQSYHQLKLEFSTGEASGPYSWGFGEGSQVSVDAGVALSGQSEPGVPYPP